MLCTATHVLTHACFAHACTQAPALRCVSAQVHCAPHNLQCPHAGGVVGVAHLRVLPMVPPWVCALLVLLALLPAAASAWACPSPRRFPGLAAYSCLCGFWLGYHVHEKAVLPVCACALGPWVQRMTWLPCARDGRSAAACTR